MKWRQKYHVTSAVHNVPSFASISQWTCRSTSQPGRNRPDACSIGPSQFRHRSATAGPQDSCIGIRVLHVCTRHSFGILAQLNMVISAWLSPSIGQGLPLLMLSLDKSMFNKPLFSNAASDWLPAELPAPIRSQIRKRWLVSNDFSLESVNSANPRWLPTTCRH